MRFLFLLYAFPPAPGVASKRNNEIASAITGKAESSFIITASANAGSSLSNTTIITIPAYDYRYFHRHKKSAGALAEGKKKSAFAQGIIRLINTFPFSVLIGEGGLIYFINALWTGHKLIRKEGITHIYSAYRPFADHYAAYWLKRKHPHICWIADFRDLIIDPHYHHIYFSGAHQLFFKKIFRKADLLTTVSDGLAKHLRKYNPNVITLRNGINNIPVSIPEVHCKYFRIAYTGSMFLDKRNAEPVFIALKELIAKNFVKRDDIRIVYAGKDNSYWNNLAEKHDLDSVLIDKGIVSGAEALTIQNNACINLLLTVSSGQLQGVLTGKMTEYFEAGSPVLGIVVHQNDPELSGILQELEIGKSFSDQKEDFDGIRDFIYSEYLFWKKNGTNRKPVRLDILREKYSVEATMRPLFEKIVGRQL